MSVSILRKRNFSIFLKTGARQTAATCSSQTHEQLQTRIWQCSWHRPFAMYRRPDQEISVLVIPAMSNGIRGLRIDYTKVALFLDSLGASSVSILRSAGAPS